MDGQTTTIEVKIETYQQLNGRKLPGDSFDDVIRRLLNTEANAASAARVGGERTDPGVKSAEEPDSPDSEGGGSVDSIGASPASGDGTGVDRDLGGLLAELDLPGGDNRVDAVRACVAHLRDVGVASRSDFIAEVYPDHRAGVGEGRWWDVVGKQGLRQVAEKHPSIEPPAGEGAHNYEWIGS